MGSGPEVSLRVAMFSAWTVFLHWSLSGPAYWLLWLWGQKLRSQKNAPNQGGFSYLLLVHVKKLLIRHSFGNFWVFTALNEIPHSPPPLPAEKPIGNTSNVTVGKPSSGDLVKKVVS